MDNTYKKGDIIFVINNDEMENGIQAGNRPYVVISNNTFNMHSPVLNCVPLTTKKKKYSPVHLLLHKCIGLSRDSYALCEQIQTISKASISHVICSLPETAVIELNKLLSFQLSL